MELAWFKFLSMCLSFSVDSLFALTHVWTFTRLLFFLLLANISDIASPNH